MTRIELISAVIVVTRDADDIAAAHRGLPRRPWHGSAGRSSSSTSSTGRMPRAMQALRALKAAGEPIEILSFATPFGESAALTVGFRHAAGDVVFTLTPEVQVAPDLLPRLLEALDGSDLVVARRMFEAAAAAGGKFDQAVNALFGTSLHDIRCGVRVMRAEVAKELTIYGNQYRFLPLLAQAQGFAVRELDLPAVRAGNGHPAHPGARRQPAARRRHHLLPAPLPEEAVPLLRRLRLRRPRGRAVCSPPGWSSRACSSASPLVDRPALVLTTLMIVLGIQIISVGLIGEIVAFTYAKDIKDYRVDRIVEPRTRLSTDLRGTRRRRPDAASGRTGRNGLTREQIRDGWVQQLVLELGRADPRAQRGRAAREPRARCWRTIRPATTSRIFAYGSLIWNPGVPLRRPRARPHPRLSSPLLPVDQPRPRDARAAPA